MQDFIKFVREKAPRQLEASMRRYVETRRSMSAFSGGEKKRQRNLCKWLILEPKFADPGRDRFSGLDIDALKTVAEGVNAMRSPDRGMLVITHYQRLLDYIKPDKVHVLAAGRIVKTGGPDLAHRLEAEGYDGVLGEAV